MLTDNSENREQLFYFYLFGVFIDSRIMFVRVLTVCVCVFACFTETWVEKPCYGKPLEEHLALSGRDIAFPIEACVTMLLECGMQEEVNTRRFHARTQEAYL